MKKLNNTGDTIVEVLIALLVVSMVLASAFVTSNRSLNNGRQAQERTEALKTLESQIEQFKVLETSYGIDTSSTTINCINPSGSMVSAYSPSKSGAMQPNTVAADPFPGTYTAACKVQNGGVTFYLSIAHETPASRDYIFRARWDKAGGNGRDEARLIYGSSAVPYVGFVGNCPLWCSISNFINNKAGGGPAKGADDEDYFKVGVSNRSYGGARTGCRWNFGDGTILNNVACNRFDGITHNYLTDGPNPKNYFPDYPTTWTCQRFRIVLTVYYTFGPPIDFDNEYGVPRFQPDGVTKCP